MIAGIRELGVVGTAVALRDWTGDKRPTRAFCHMESISAVDVDEGQSTFDYKY